MSLISETAPPANTQKVAGGGILPLKGGSRIDLEKSFPLREGTLSAWVRPINWDGETAEMVPLFRAEDEGSWWRVFKYRIDSNNYGLTFVFGQPSKEGERNYVFATTPIRDWRKNEWHHIAVTWSENDGEIRVFIDGEDKASAGINKDRLPKGAPRGFEIASPNTKPGGDIFRTAFDRVDLFNEPLPVDAIVKLSKRSVGSEIPPLESVPPSVVTIPRTSRPPKVDGVPAPGEWEGAAKFPGGLAISEPFIRLGKTFIMHATYDAERIYILAVSPTPDMQLRADTLESGNVRISLDDAIEVLLAPSGSPADYYQIIGNSQGYFYSNYAGDKNWQSGLEFANTLYEGFWYAELSIPFTALGLKQAPEPGTRWKGNFCRDWASDTGTVFTSWSFTPDSFYSHMGEIVFGEADSGYALEVDEKDLDAGKITGELVSFSSESKKVRIRTEDGGGVHNTLQKDVSSKEALAFSETPPLGRITNLQVEVLDKDGIALRQPIPLRAESSIKLTVEPDPDKEQLTVGATLGQENRDLSGTLRIKDADGKVLRDAELRSDNQGNGEIILDAKDLPEGRYRISLESNGQTLVERNYDHIGRAEWRNWKSEFKGVPEPWTPIEYSDASLGFWGREYALGADPLPTGISALGHPVIRGPILLDTVANGQKISWSSDMSWQQKNPENGSYVITGGNEHWKFTATVHFEFDGFWWMDLDAEPLRPDSSLDRLVLSIPFAPGVAKLVYAHDHSRKREQGEVTRDSLGEFHSNIWIGNDDIGLTWFAESDQYWRASDPKAVARFHPDESGGKLEICLVDTAFTPKGAVRYGFGIQATPVRPLDAGRRIRRIDPTASSVLAHPWQLDRSVKRYGVSDKEWGFLSPHFTSVEAVKAEVSKWREKGLEMPWYIAPDIISPQSTEFQVFRDEWKNPHAVYQFGCANSSFSNFTNREMETLVRDAGLRSVYVDCAKAYPCGNDAHGCGYRDDDGKLHLTSPVRALREYLKNLYVTLKANGGHDASLILHLSGGLSSAAHGFSDIVLEGEEVQYMIGKTPSYFDLMPPMMWRTIFGQAYGINVMLLPNYGRVGPKEHQQSEILNATFMTQALLTDTPVWNLWTNVAYVNRIYSALDQFGYRAPDVKFEPYWKQDAVSVQGSDLKVSIYHTERGVLLAIGNFGKERGDGQLSLNLEKLGFGSQEVSITNLMSGVPLSGNSNDISVPPENFVLLAVESKNPTP